jgi:hypothetical protein
MLKGYEKHRRLASAGEEIDEPAEDVRVDGETTGNASDDVPL